MLYTVQLNHIPYKTDNCIVSNFQYNVLSWNTTTRSKTILPLMTENYKNECTIHEFIMTYLFYVMFRTQSAVTSDRSFKQYQ